MQKTKIEVILEGWRHIKVDVVMLINYTLGQMKHRSGGCFIDVAQKVRNRRKLWVVFLSLVDLRM